MEVHMRTSFRWMRNVLVLLCAASFLVSPAQAKKGDAYQTGFDEWLASAGSFGDWTLSGAALTADSKLTLSPDAVQETDPYAAGSYYGGNFYTGGSYWV